MNNSPKVDLNPRVPATFTAGLVVLLLLGIAYFNLPTTPAYFTTTQGLNVYRGPGENWFPAIGSLGTNQSFNVLARSPDGLWFKIEYFNGIGWVQSRYTTLSVDPAQLPVDAGFPTANLVLRNVYFEDTLPLTCGKPVSISVDIANDGNQATTSTGHVRIQDVIRDQYAESRIAAVTTGIFPPIGSGQSITVSNLVLTVSSFARDYHWIYITINLDDDVPDTNSMDNGQTFYYILQGDC